MHIYTYGPIGYEAAEKLYRENKAAYDARFPAFFLRAFEKQKEKQAAEEELLDILCIEKNTGNSYSRKNFYFDGSIYFREISEGGIFGALWKACEDLAEIRREEGKRLPVGCRVFPERIPLDQYTVEILAYGNENPYEVSAKGSWLILAEDAPAELVRIGSITEGADRILCGKERNRFLTPPSRQEKDAAARRNDIERKRNRS